MWLQPADNLVVSEARRTDVRRVIERFGSHFPCFVVANWGETEEIILLAKLVSTAFNSYKLTKFDV